MASPCFVAGASLLPRPAAPSAAPLCRVGPAARLSGAVRRPRQRSPRRAPTTVPAPSVPPTAPKTPPPPPPPSAPAEQYGVRDAAKGELYTVSDVRCGAFYQHPTDPYFYPMRRREIYTALCERVAGGTRCLVALDRTPPPDWAPFCGREGGLVVASLDLTLHHAASGRRVRFDAPRDGPERRLYVSSMAVRAEWRRRGLARKLLEQVEREAGRLGVAEIFLHVDMENAAAVALYAREGFKPAEGQCRIVPSWLAFLAKREHTLLRKRVAGLE